MLGRNVLHFTKSEVVFECVTGLNCECGSMADFSGDWLLLPRCYLASRSWDGEEDVSTLFTLDLSQRGGTDQGVGQFSDLIIPDLPARDPSFLNWRAIVSEYSERSMTKSSDRLPALAGVASQWHPKKEGRYLAGIWSQDLFRSLLWKASGPDRDKDTGYIAPTWSWASVKRTVTWISNDLRSKFFVEIDLSKSGVSLKGRNTFGEVTGGWLYLSCQAADITLERQREYQDQQKVDLRLDEKQLTLENVDSRHRWPQLNSREGLWVKYCHEYGYERALVLARVPNEHLAGLPLEVQMHPMVFWRIGVVEFVPKGIKFPGMREVSLYIV